MVDITADELAFFEKQAAALLLYETLKKKITERFPETDVQVRKTQINLKNRYVFACVSFLKVLKKSMLPDPYLVLTLGLPYPLGSERVAAKTEAYPGRWTTHVVLGKVEEIDDELIAWVLEAYAFANIK